jgi:hypothetical protein
VSAGAPLVVSITTLPSRIGRIGPTLESLMVGERRPDLIRVVVPDKPLRESEPLALPDFLTDEAFHRGLVTVATIPRDFGPGSKLLGSIGAIPEPSCLVIADDDVRYRRDFLSGLYEAQMADRASSFSYYTYPVGGIMVGQGCDGFSFWTPNLAGIGDFFAAYVDGSDLMFHDDLWISFFLASRGVKVKSLHHRLGGSLIYEQVYESNALRHLDGALAREELNLRGYRNFIDRVEMPSGRRAGIRATEAYRRYVSGPPRRIVRKIKRLAGRAD